MPKPASHHRLSREQATGTPTVSDQEMRDPQSELDQLRAGKEKSLIQLLSAYRDSLERMVAFRVDSRLRGRLDAGDVLQESYLRLARRLDDYLANPSAPVFVWIRQQTLQTLIDLQRGHFRARRDPQREARPDASGTSSHVMAACLIDSITTPSQVVARAEERLQVRAALDAMHETDREVLALRHFEQLTNQQVAAVLGLSATAASNRYMRAAAKLAVTLRAVMKSDAHQITNSQRPGGDNDE